MTPTRRQILLYGLPGLALAMPTLPIYVYLPSFYATEVGLDLSSIGIALLLARLTDIITDPLIGSWSDRLKGRFGRRKPFMVIGGLIAAVALFELVTPTADADFFYLLGWAMALYLGWTLINIPYTAWGAELADTYHDRTRIASSREAAMVIGLLIAASLPVVVQTIDGAPNAGLLAIAAVALAIGIPSFTLLMQMVPEPVSRPRKPVKLRDGLPLLLRNQPFRRLLAAWFLNSIANGLPATLFPLFALSVLGMSDGDRDLSLLLYFAMAVIGIPLWMRFSRRFGKHPVWCAAMALACVAFAGALALSSGDSGWFILICLTTGLMLGADLVLPPAMQADVLDLDRVQSEDERAGLLFALWSMAQKLALAIAVGVAFPLLDLAGFEAGSVASDGLWALTGLYAGVPILFKLAAIQLVRHHPMTEAEQRKLRDQLDRRNTVIAGGAE